MAVRARILIDAVAGSDTDFAIDTLAQLDNDGLGTEATFLWSVLHQPPGGTDALSNTTIENPTFTPTREGSYVIRLVVDSGLITEATDVQVIRVLQLKSRQVAPGANETTNADASAGWAVTLNAMLKHHDDQIARGSCIVASAGSAGLVRGTVVRFNGAVVLKPGLYGEEVVAVCIAALSTVAANVNECLGVIEEGVDGDLTPDSGDLVRVRLLGVFAEVGTVASPAVGDPVYVSNTGTLVLVAGTAPRIVGHVIAVVPGSSFDMMFSGPDLSAAAAALSYGTPVTVGIANAAGASTDVARADHVHAGQLVPLSLVIADADGAATTAIATTAAALGRFVPMFLALNCTAASGITTHPTISVGTAAGSDIDIIPATLLNFTAANQSRVISPNTAAPLPSSVPAATSIRLVRSGGVTTTYALVATLWGYYTGSV